MSPPNEQVNRNLPVCSTESRGRSTIVAIDGEIDCATASLVESEIRTLLVRGESRLALDLRRVGFLGVAGLHVFAAIDREVRLRGGQLDIIASTRQQRMFAITGLDQSVRLHDEIDDTAAPRDRTVLAV